MKFWLVGLLMAFSTHSFAKVTLAQNPTIKFTGYKFTDKVGVSGSFKTVEWKINQKAKTLKELVEKSTVRIDSHSLDAGDEARNVNINGSLLKKWGGRYIDIKFSDFNEERRVVKAELTIGDEDEDLYFQYHENDKGVYIFTATMNLLQMGFGDAYAALEEMCGPLHTGEDGVRKSWPDVDIEVAVTLKK